ncbi:hypothetical protein [Flexithrix dorotheae]|uniref:hypothetical protein n=1 Tax=Flexithrix dorotheae TaxID=70993 RepID=UPI00036B1A25|nr:hypothetical protein [Flexithrix dorotheae]
MKFLLINFLLFFIISSSIYAQSHGISYQAVLIDENAFEIPGVDIVGSHIGDTELTIRFSILNAAGGTDYQEEQLTKTDEFGMINVIIGEGNSTGNSPGNFEDIDWDGTPKNLMVEIKLEENATDFEEFSNQALYFVPYAFHRNITATGTMEVDGNTTLNGTTTLNSTLTVANASNTSLTGDLNVDGLSTLAELEVEGESDLNGQVTITADINGSQNNVNSYPLVVQGSDQGISIKVDGGRNASKNFVTFRDGSGIHGRIEGQTLAELQSSFRFIWDFTMAGLEEAFVLAEGLACGTQLDAAEVIVMGLEGLKAYSQWIELSANAELNVGVAFETGGADYAEWLEKADPNESFTEGDIVGVYAGKISKKTTDADHVMVISTNPIIVGNMPESEKENQFEKVAFLGQVPVKVVGKVELGDYILASGNQDGFGIAISPEKMKIEDYSKIAGVAWQTSDGGTTNFINMAVGINNNDLASVVAKQAAEIESLKKQINEIYALLKGKSVNGEHQVKTAVAPKNEPNGSPSPTLISKKMRVQQGKKSLKITEEEFENWLNDYGYIFEEKMRFVKEQFQLNNVNIEKYPEVKILIENPTKAFRDMRNGQYMNTLWQSFEQKYLEQVKD